METEQLDPSHQLTSLGVGTVTRPPEPTKDPDAKLRTVLPLLVEYTEKLRDFTVPGHKIGLKVHAAFPQYLTAAKRFAQFVSQRLDTTHDDILHFELLLRLAEYEAALATAEQRLP